MSPGGGPEGVGLWPKAPAARTGFPDLRVPPFFTAPSGLGPTGVWHKGPQLPWSAEGLGWAWLACAEGTEWLESLSPRSLYAPFRAPPPPRCCPRPPGGAGLRGCSSPSRVGRHGGWLSPGRATPELPESDQKATDKVWDFISFWVNKSIFNKTLSF